MTNLSEPEKAHLDAFKAARPDWKMLVSVERFCDESAGEKPHTYRPNHPYIMGMKYVLDRFRCSGRAVDIGSPIAQNVALAATGVKVTVLDIRKHPDPDILGLDWMEGSACEMPFADESIKFLTSCWVIGHVGDGRYGDAFEVDGDVKMLREIHRVLEPHGRAIVGFGLIDEEPGLLFNLHRIYSWDWIREAVVEAGLRIAEIAEFPIDDEMYIDVSWTDVSTAVYLPRRSGYYGIATLTKA